MPLGWSLGLAAGACVVVGALEIAAAIRWSLELAAGACAVVGALELAAGACVASSLVSPRERGSVAALRPHASSSAARWKVSIACRLAPLATDQW